MVEVKLDPVDPFFADRNTYVSMRVGEVQKLGRAATSRTYTFAPKVVGDRKFGKIDIFKRVGTCTVGILPDGDVDQLVSIPLDDKSSAKFKVSLRCFGEKVPSSSVDAPRPGQEKKVSEANPKVLAAKTYLERHRLEMRLSEAMQEVIRLEPIDPCAYIAEKLTKTGSTVSYLPKEQAPPVPSSNDAKQPSEEVAPPAPPEPVPTPSPEPPPEDFVISNVSTSVEAIPTSAEPTPTPPLVAESVPTLEELVAIVSTLNDTDLRDNLKSIFSVDLRNRLLDAVMACNQELRPEPEKPKTALAAFASDVRRERSSSCQETGGSTSSDAQSTPTLDELSAAIGTTSDADLVALLNSFPVDLRKKLLDMVLPSNKDSAGSTSSSTQSTPTLAELSAAIATTSDTDLVALLNSFPVDLRKKLLDMVLPSNKDSVGSTSSGAQSTPTLGELCSAIVTTSDADLDAILKAFPVDLKKKLLDTVLSLNKDGTDAMQKAPATNAVSQAEALRLKAKEALTTATSDGRLDAALESRRNSQLSQEPAKEQDKSDSSNAKPEGGPVDCFVARVETATSEELVSVLQGIPRVEQTRLMQILNGS